MRLAGSEVRESLGGSQTQSWRGGFFQADSGQGALVHGRKLPSGIILNLRSEHENHSRAFANCSFPVQRVLTC